MSEDLTRDDFLGGQLSLLQPRQGYRAGVDPVLLAAACPARAGQSVLELGCGVGAAFLCLAARVEGLIITAVERQPNMADLARRNAEAMSAAVDVVTGDIAALPHELRQRSFDHVILNPPYFLRNESSPSEHSAREAAMGEDTPLSLWLSVAAKRLAPKGWVTLIHRAERLDDLLAGLAPLGSIQIQPLQARVRRDANLVLIRARKGGRAALRLHAPVILHNGSRHLSDGDDYTPEIASVLRQAAAFPGFGTN